MIKISFQNSGGELDSRTAKSPTAAVEAMVEMIREAGELHDGDTIVVTEE